MIYFEIMHVPFADGTPRHPLMSIQLKGNHLEKAKEIMKESSLLCEGDEVFDYWTICPQSLSPDQKDAFDSIMEGLGIVASIYVEYCFKTKN